jgi:thiamine-monophosphate kinase
MLITNYGEYKLHEWVRQFIGKSDDEFLGIGDDCAVLDILENDYLLLTSDRVPLGLTGDYAGRFCVVQNIADIIAMGGTPKGLLLDIYLPRSSSVEDFKSIVQGANSEAIKYGTKIIGGDTKESPTFMVVGVAIGVVRRDRVLTRHGTKPGDIVCITRTNGKRYGMRWAKIVSDFFQLKLDQVLSVALEDAYNNMLQLPLQEITYAAEIGGVTSCTDMSDGLGGALEIIGRENALGFSLYEQKLLNVIDPQARSIAELLSTDPLKMILSPGYDWEMLCTIDSDLLDATRKAVCSCGGDIIPIGEVTKTQKISMIRLDGAICGLNTFSDEKFKIHPWEKQPDAWLAHSLYC